MIDTWGKGLLELLRRCLAYQYYSYNWPNAEKCSNSTANYDDDIFMTKLTEDCNEGLRIQEYGIEIVGSTSTD